ncbi:type 1 glutamine amidotransferase [Haladaptatus sp. T7]|uniref:type 1 glutamine amidotransferase n=1 Tax=Haladaptatus sp. T7 TaxID=2029368 RepID=UPI0021A250F7|nr:type 1 glutamine amidotransferase [Haladaptatus sp. T7]GKZ15298.1 amidotransferase [Haladaptatus sp. T7]
MGIHYLQHVPFEGPGTIRNWATDRGHDLKGTHLYNDESLPDLDTFDWLIVMGGPMSVHDTDEFPWLAAETDFIRATVNADKTVVGICLGAKLVAEALGGRVHEADTSEIVWFSVEATDEATESPLFADLGGKYDAFHWHGDTFDLPEGATRMARTDACLNQAFVYEGRVVGLQFHLESPPATVDEIIANSGNLHDSTSVTSPPASDATRLPMMLNISDRC